MSTVIQPEAARTRQLISQPRSPGLRSLPRAALLLDVLLMLCSIALAAVGRDHVPFLRASQVAEQTPLLLPVAMVVLWVTCVHVLDGYRPEAFGAGTEEYKRIANATLVTAAALGIACYLARYPLSRGFFVLAFVFGVSMLVIGRYLLRRLLKRARRQGLLLHRVALVGPPGYVDDLAGVLRRESWLGYDVVAALTPSGFVESRTPAGTPVWGNSEDVAFAADELGVDVVFLASGAFDASSNLRQAVWDLERHDVQVIVVPGFNDVAPERLQVRPIAGLALMHLAPPRAPHAVRWAKRAFDAVGSALLLVAFSPVFLLTTAAIKRFDGGPVFFRHTRVGLDGRPFRCLKFRTMVVGADQLVRDLQAATSSSALLFKMKDDPRITRPGRWMRRFSLDELPQLLNVLRGEMSLVGPRPQVDREVELYTDALRRRLRVRPGMTGLWQVSGRSDLSPDEAARLDLYYVDNWSMITDLHILWRTVGAVLRSRGAY